MNKLFLGLITRCKDEFFIKDFCNYYLSEGVDKIYIIDDDSNNKSIYNNLNNSKINIIYEKNIININYAQTLYEKIKNNFEWIIYVDVDEFITTKKNINNTIRDELKTTFKYFDCVKVPWVLMSCNKIKKNPKNILTNIFYRWNHNYKHPHKNNIHKFRCRYNSIEVKCIFKPDKFEKITDHFPESTNNNIICCNSINAQNDELKKFYNNLRENNINNGYLLCYHYRIISEENCQNKLKTNKWYIEDGYTLDDLMLSDYAEIIDFTIRNKYIKYNKNIKNYKIVNIGDIIQNEITDNNLVLNIIMNPIERIIYTFNFLKKQNDRKLKDFNKCNDLLENLNNNNLKILDYLDNLNPGLCYYYSNFIIISIQYIPKFIEKNINNIISNKSYINLLNYYKTTEFKLLFELIKNKEINNKVLIKYKNYKLVKIINSNYTDRKEK